MNVKSFFFFWDHIFIFIQAYINFKKRLKIIRWVLIYIISLRYTARNKKENYTSTLRLAEYLPRMQNRISFSFVTSF